MSSIYPVVLCGGVGTRLWPLSRTLQPKQFQAINGESSTTFFQSTVQRHRNGIFGDTFVCVMRDHLGTVRRQLREIQCNARIIAEPMARNTGPAVLSAALVAVQADPEALLAIFPADHVIAGDLNARIASALPAAEEGHIVTFGIVPRYGETGYGYVLDGGKLDDYHAVHSVAKFVEKPSEAIADALVAAGNAYWASGISLFRADVLIQEYRRLDPVTFGHVSNAVEHALVTGNEVLLNDSHFCLAGAEPTERVVFENSPRMVLAPTEIDWDDVGAWAALHAIGAKSPEGNVTSGDVIMVDTSNSFVRSGNRLVAVVGMSDVVVVDTHDALLVTTRQNSQKVKSVVEKLASMKRNEVVDHSSKATDWGSASALARGAGYSLELLNVNPGSTMRFDALSDRRRLLTVGSGKATLEIGNVKHLLSPGRTIEIAADQEGLLTNGLNAPVQLVQVTCDSEPVVDPIKQAVDFVDVKIKREYV